MLKQEKMGGEGMRERKEGRGNERRREVRM